MILNSHILDLSPYRPGRTVAGAVKLSSNENPLGPSPLALDAVSGILKEVNRYPDGASLSLRARLADLWGLSSENFLIGNGSDEILVLLAALCLGPEKAAVGTRETFSEYRFSARLFNAEMVEVSLHEGKYNLAAMRALVDDRTRMVFLCNPNNPTGTYRTHEEIAAFLEGLPRGVLVVLDEAYADFADADDFPDSRELLRQYENLVVVRTFSKLYGLAGLRIGYAVGRPELISGVSKASTPFNVNSLAQAAAQAALGDDEHRRKSLDLVRRERVFLHQGLGERGIFYYPTQANFICMGFNTDTADLWRPIAERGIAIRDLQSFGLPRMARYTLGTRENNERFLAILDELLS